MLQKSQGFCPQKGYSRWDKYSQQLDFYFEIFMQWSRVQT